MGWIALVPLLLALRRVSSMLTAMALGLLFGIAFLAQTLPWLLTMFSERWLCWYLAALALPFALFAGADHLVRRKFSATLPLLLTPVLWVAADFLRCEGWHYQFSWAQLGFTQVPWLVGRALYPQLGVYGVSFLMVAANAALATLVSTRDRGSRVYALGLLASIVLLLAVALPLQHSVPWQSAHPLTALVVQDEHGGLARLRSLTLAASAARPDLVVWPEYAGGNLLASPAHMAQVQRL
ncbi:MAG TPA: hypothetical protein VGL77_10385, partial [Armatimonadota bacterium]